MFDVLGKQFYRFNSALGAYIKTIKAPVTRIDITPVENGYTICVEDTDRNGYGTTIKVIEE